MLFPDNSSVGVFAQPNGFPHFNKWYVSKGTYPNGCKRSASEIILCNRKIMISSDITLVTHGACHAEA